MFLNVLGIRPFIFFCSYRVATPVYSRETGLFSSVTIVATLDDSVIVRREDADGYAFAKTRGVDDFQFLMSSAGSAPRCPTMDIRGPVAEYPARRSVQPALLPMWSQKVSTVSGDRIALAVDGDLPPPFVLQPVTDGSAITLDLEVLSSPASPAIYGGSLWHMVDGQLSASFVSSAISNWSSLTFTFPTTLNGVAIPRPILFWVAGSTEILYASRTGDALYSITSGGAGMFFDRIFSGRNSVVRGADNQIVYFLTENTTTSQLVVQEGLNRTYYDVPSALHSDPDAYLMAGELTVLAFLINGVGQKVAQVFDEGNWTTPGPTVFIGIGDVPTFLASMDRIIYFQVYYPVNNKFVVYSFDEEALAIVQICSFTVPQVPADTKPSVAIVNQLLAIRWPHGAVRLVRRSLFAALPDFGPTPVFMKSRKLIWATQGPTARLFFSHFDHSIGETALVSPMLPCIDNIDCATYVPGSTCTTSNFCDTGPAPTTQPGGPPTLPPPVNRGSPLAGSVPASAASPTSQGSPNTLSPRPPVAPPVTLCVPPAPVNAVCGPNGWVINSTVVVSPGSTVIITSPTIINGNLSISSGSTLNVTFPANGSPTAPIVVNGCVQFAGTLNVDIGQPPTSNVNSPLITFDGYCGGVQTNFTVTSINLGCAKLKPGASGLQYGERSLTLLFSKDDVDESGCSSGVAGGLSTGAIVGIAVGAAALVLLVIFITLWVNRARLIPHYRVEAEMKNRSSALVNKNV
jgi:hypothetical protein